MKDHIHIAALALAILALAACSKAPQATTPPSTVAAAAAPTQPGTPPCGPCEAGFIGLQLTGLANFTTVKQNDLRIPVMVQSGGKNQSMDAGKSGKLPITATADWWTDGGTLRITADSGTPAMSWNPMGAKDRDTPPMAGARIPAGWYYSYVTCSTAQCRNVAVTVDGKPVVPYYMPPRQ